MKLLPKRMPSRQYLVIGENCLPAKFPWERLLLIYLFCQNMSGWMILLGILASAAQVSVWFEKWSRQMPQDIFENFRKLPEEPPEPPENGHFQ